MASAQPARQSSRIAGLDLARAIAIAFAMVGHCFVHFGVWELLAADTVVALRAFVRSATPTFIILFGMMLEIVYLKMLRDGERQGCWLRLITRAIQCYLLYLCVVAAGVLGGQLAPLEGAKAALFLSGAYFANILKFYSLGLVAGIALLELRLRHGLRSIAGVAVVIWLAWPLVKALPPLPPSLSHLGSFLIGAGTVTGPSVLQGMTLAALGMLLGHALLRGGAKLLVPLALAALLPVGALMATAGVGRTFANFADYGFRAANHPTYYLLGSAFALCIVAGCVALAPRLPRAALARLNVFGVSSLFAYGIGNVVLNLLPPLRDSLPLGLLASVVFLACLYAMTAYFQQAVQAPAGGTPPRSPGARVARLHGRLRLMTMRLAGVFVVRLLSSGRPAREPV